MRFICLFVLAATLVATLPNDDLTVSPNPSSDLFLYGTSNDPTNTLEGNNDDDLFLDAGNSAEFSSSSNDLIDNLDSAELEEAFYNSGIEQP